MSSSTTDDDAPKFYDSISDRYDKYYAHDPGLLAFIKSSLGRLSPDASVRLLALLLRIFLLNFRPRRMQGRSVCFDCPFWGWIMKISVAWF